MGIEAGLHRLLSNNAKAILRKRGVPEIEKLSRWEVIDVVQTLSAKKAKACKEAWTKSPVVIAFLLPSIRGDTRKNVNAFFFLQNRVILYFLASNEVFSTDEGESEEE